MTLPGRPAPQRLVRARTACQDHRATLTCCVLSAATRPPDSSRAGGREHQSFRKLWPEEALLPAPDLGQSRCEALYQLEGCGRSPIMSGTCFRVPCSVCFSHI